MERAEKCHLTGKRFMARFERGETEHVVQ